MPSPWAAPPPKKVSKIPPPPPAAAEDFAEDIEGIVEPAAAPALGKGGVPVAVVGGAFLLVHEDVVGFAELLEFLFRVRVVGIFIGVKLDREFAIRALDLVAAGGALDAEDFVVIAFGGHFGKINRCCSICS